MKQVPVKLGPLALLLTIISICLTTMAILTFTTAQADQRLADQFAKTVETRYHLESEGQEFLAEAQEAARSDDMIMMIPYRTSEKDVYERQIQEGEASLTIRLRKEGNQCRILSWKIVHSWEEDDGINIWDGQIQ